MEQTIESSAPAPTPTTPPTRAWKTRAAWSTKYLTFVYGALSGALFVGVCAIAGHAHLLSR